MKKTETLVVISIIALALAALTFEKPELPPASRGKVIAGNQSSLFDQNLNTASILSFQTTDSTGVISGQVCVINNNDQSTGEFVEMVPRRFPRWFVFGCQQSGTIIRYQLNSAGKAVIQFSNAQRRGPSRE